MSGPAAAVRLSVDPGSQPAATRISVQFDKILYASPGMVNLGTHPERITITRNGIYVVEGWVTYDLVSGGSEFGANLTKNGLPAPAGPGQFIGLFTALGPPVSTFQTFSCHKVIDVRVGDYFGLEIQSDNTFRIDIQEDPTYFQWSPMLSVTFLQPIP